MKDKKLEVGEKYLKGKLGGKNGIDIVLFKNKDKINPKEPDYTGSIQIALWINTKKEKKSEEDI